MERDFMGLAPKKVKQEVTDDGCYDSAMQWSFSSKGSTPPQFLSFKGPQEDKPMIRTGYDSLSSTTGYMTISTTTDAIESNNKQYSSVLQKKLNLGKQGGGHYGVTNYSALQFDSNSVHRPILHSAGQNVITSTAAGAVVGHTDLRNGSRPAGAPAQLTIFYDGMVCVFDDVSREKAEAIMLLAGNGALATPKATTLPSAQLQPTQLQRQIPLPPTTTTTRPSTGNPFLLNQSHTNTSPCLSLSRNISLPTLNNASHSLRGTTNINNNNDKTSLKPIITSPSCTILESSNVLRPQLPPPIRGTLIQNAVPQARKASLARFLEKRKERAMGASPYVLPDCTTPTTGNKSISFNSAGSSPLPATT